MKKARLIERIAELVRGKDLKASATSATSPRPQGVRVVIDSSATPSWCIVRNQPLPTPDADVSYGIVPWPSTRAAADPGARRSEALHPPPPRGGDPPQPLRAQEARDRLHIVEGLLVATGHHSSTTSSPSSASRTTSTRPAGPCSTSVERRPLGPPQLRRAPQVDLARDAEAAMDVLVARAPGRRAQVPGLARSTQRLLRGAGPNILDMRLQRLTGLQRDELFNELHRPGRGDRPPKTSSSTRARCSRSSRPSWPR